MSLADEYLVKTNVTFALKYISHDVSLFSAYVLQFDFGFILAKNGKIMIHLLLCLVLKLLIHCTRLCLFLLEIYKISL